MPAPPGTEPEPPVSFDLTTPPADFDLSTPAFGLTPPAFDVPRPAFDVPPPAFEATPAASDPGPPASDPGRPASDPGPVASDPAQTRSEALPTRQSLGFAAAPVPADYAAPPDDRTPERTVAADPSYIWDLAATDVFPAATDAAVPPDEAPEDGA